MGGHDGPEYAPSPLWKTAWRSDNCFWSQSEGKKHDFSTRYSEKMSTILDEYEG